MILNVYTKRLFLIAGTVLLYSTAITPVWAVDVSTWSQLNENKAESSITLTQDILAEGTPKVVNLAVAGDQTIDGNGHAIIGANGYSMTLNGTSGSVTMKNLGSYSTVEEAGEDTFSYTNLDGETVHVKIDNSVNSCPAYFTTRYQNNTALNVDNSVFTDNGARLIIMSGSTNSLNVTNSIFADNTTKYALITGAGVINVENSIFYNNKNTNDDGAAMDISNSNSVVSIKNSYFINNSAKFGGVINQIAGILTIDESKFEGNTSAKDGGAFCLDTNINVGYIKNSEFINNRNGGSYYDGGAISTTGGYIEKIENVLFENNVAVSGGGGVWGGMHSKHASKAPVLIKDTIFKSNEAGQGGGYYSEGEGSGRQNYTYITDSTFTNNIVQKSGHYLLFGIPIGGGMVNTGGIPMVINNTVFSGNTADPGDNYSAGGGIYFAGGGAAFPLKIVDSTFTDNSALEGGALFVDNADAAIIADNKDVVFSGNVAGADADDYNGGSDIYFQANSYKGTLSLNAAADKKVVFNGSIASYYEDADHLPTIEINNSGVTYNTYDGTTETPVTAGTTGEIQFNGRLGDDTYQFNANVYDGTLTLGNKASLDTVNIQGGTLNIANNPVTATTVNFGANSTLALTVNSLTDFGSVTADTINVTEGAQLKATLAQGIVPDGGTASLQLLSADNEDFNNFADSFDNNMYHFEKDGKNGKYIITSSNSAEDVVIDQVGQPWVAGAAKAYVDGAQFQAGSVGADVANKLAALAQNNASALASEIKALAPSEAPIVHDHIMNDSSRLFRVVDNHLRGYRDPAGVSAGDMLSDVSVWAKPYYGKSKVSNRDAFERQKSYGKGIIAGLQKKLNSDFELGVGVHYDETEIDMLRRDVDVDTVNGFVFGEYRIDDWFVNATTSYGLSDYEENRLALGSQYTAKYDVYTTSVAATTGYQFNYFVPEVGLRYYHIKRNEYTDTAGQYVHKSDMNYLRAVGGVRYTQNFGMISPDIYLGVSYDLKSPKDSTLVSLSNGSTYFVEGQKLPRLTGELSLGLNTYLTDNFTLGTNLMGAYRKDYREYSGMVRLKYDF